MQNSLKDQLKYVYANAEEGKQLKLCNDYTIRAASFSKNELSKDFLLTEDFVSLHLVKTPIKNKKIANAIEVMIENFRNETNSYNSNFDDGDELYFFSAPRIGAKGEIKESVVYGVGFVHFSGKNCEGAWLHPFFRGKGLIKGFFIQYALSRGVFKPVPPFSFAISKVLYSVSKEINSRKDNFSLYRSQLKKLFYEELFQGCLQSDVSYEEITEIKFKEKEIDTILSFANTLEDNISAYRKEKLGAKELKKMNRSFIVNGSAMMNAYIQGKDRVETDEDVIKFQKFMQNIGTEMLTRKGATKEEIEALGKDHDVLKNSIDVEKILSRSCTKE